MLEGHECGFEISVLVRFLGVCAHRDTAGINILSSLAFFNSVVEDFEAIDFLSKGFAGGHNEDAHEEDVMVITC